jgi:endonuclease/exonuclease/phosphatase family metal-dependent hydrolase
MDSGAVDPARGFSAGELDDQSSSPAEPTWQPTLAAGGAATETVTVLTYNVGFASGMANNRPVTLGQEEGRKNLHAVMSVLAVQQPDLAALQEVDGAARRSFFVDQARELARAADLEHGCFTPNWNKRYVPFPPWPPSVHYGPIYSGLALLSRYPIIDHETIPLPPPAKNPVYRALYLRRVIQRTRVRLPGGRPVTLLNLHLEPFDQENRRRHAEIAATICESVADPLIVTGDCNAPPEYATVRSDFASDAETADFTTDETLRILTEETGLSNVFDETRYLRNEAAALTFPSDAPVVTLDYILHNDSFEAEDASVIRTNARGSDHLPIAARLRLR